MVRYVFLLMGIMATYCGLVYNEFFALSLNLFGSCYDMNVPTPIYGEEDKVVGAEEKETKYFFKRLHPNCNYPFGLDPAYGAAENEL